MTIRPRPRASLPPLAAATPIELRPRGDFVEWLSTTGGTLAVSTYNSGKLALLSAPEGRLAATFLHFARPMGVAVEGERLALVTQEHISLFRTVGGVSDAGDGFHCSAASASETPPTPKASLVHRLELIGAYQTGRVDAHDLAFDRRGLLFANTRFNCVARATDRASFLRAWQPAFVPRTMRKDCCHLNGVGVRDGRLAVATAFCESGALAAWREGDRFTSGVLVDVRHKAIAARGLCVPHSPRWHDGCWWLCNSGEGTLCRLDRAHSVCEPVAALPGFTRGLTFAADRAIVGLSRIRKRHILDAPPVRGRWPALRAGLALVDPARGAETGSLEFIRGGREVFDVAFLPAPSP